MKDKELLRIEQLEQVLRPYRGLLKLEMPRRGWVRAVREALGMTTTQLAKRIGASARQSLEGMQEDEVDGTIKIQTLRKIAAALECEFVYALVPRESLQDIRREQATLVARRLVDRVSHSMSLEDQRVSKEAQQKELIRRIDKLLAGNPKTLWD